MRTAYLEPCTFNTFWVAFLKLVSGSAAGVVDINILSTSMSPFRYSNFQTTSKTHQQMFLSKNAKVCVWHSQRRCFLTFLVRPKKPDMRAGEERFFHARIKPKSCAVGNIDCISLRSLEPENALKTLSTELISVRPYVQAHTEMNCCFRKRREEENRNIPSCH